MSLLCKNCGAQAEEDKSFCMVCGAKLQSESDVKGKPSAFKGTPLCRKNKKPLWIVAVLAQLLCVIMFFLPTVRVTVTVPAQYADKIPSYSDFLKGEKSEDEGVNRFFSEEKEEKTYEDVDVLEGDFRLMNVIDFFGTEAYQTMCLTLVLISFALFVAPLIRGKELKAHNALLALFTQVLFFVVNIATLLSLKDEPVSSVRKFADMIVYAKIPEFIVDWLCESIGSFYSYKFNVWGWAYVVFSVIAIAVLCKLVIDNRKEFKRE